MALIGKLLQNAIKINRRLSITRKSMQQMQRHTLRKLLRTAAFTDFGRHYDFEEILRSPDVIQAYQSKVPLFDYDKIHKEWWYRSINGERDVTWPGKIKNFALSSGTTGSSSKMIPISKDMLLSIRKASFRQLCTLKDFDIPDSFYEKEMLMLGGSTHLEQFEHAAMGDLSGILTGNLPIWMNRYYKPGNQISKENDWNKKLDIITREAHKWDIGIVAGVPAWVQILFERIIDYYKVDTIHDIWPNFRIYVHGGVSLAPYKERFKTLLGRDLIYLETYLASEGFIAFERLNGIGAMSLVMRNGIFYEFIPFNSENFNADGELLENAKALGLSEIKEGEEYAIVLTTNAGAYRYLIGDTVKFTDLKYQELIITGRIKHFLSLCGEHLSVGNMNDAIYRLNQEFDLQINEFTVVGDHFENRFSHTWWIGTEKEIDPDKIKERLDEILISLNDDYNTERKEALKEIFVHLIPNQYFYDWMESQNKMGGSHKFPRVLNKKQFESWTLFLKEKNSSIV